MLKDFLKLDTRSYCQLGKYVQKITLVLLVWSIMLFSLSSCFAPDSKKSLKILAAASLSDLMNELKDAYQKNHNVDLQFSFAASGSLQAQIEEGAEADIFISASKKQIKKLQDKSLLHEDSIKDVLANSLVIVSNKNKSFDFKGEESIKNLPNLISDGKIKSMSIGDPSYVPAGQYAKEALDFYGVYDKIKDKLVLGNSVRNVLSWVSEGGVDLAVVYKTDAMIDKNVEIIHEFDSKSHSPILYQSAIIKSSKNISESEDFIKFLSSEEGAKIIEKYGFTPISVK